MVFLLLAVLIGLVPAMIAAKKGRNFAIWWIYGSLIFIVALPHALLARGLNESVDAQQQAAGNVKCPHCAEWIRPEAKVCKHCGRDVSVS